MFIGSSIVTTQLYAFYDQNACLDDGDSVDLDGFLDLIRRSLLTLQSPDVLANPEAGVAVVNLIAAYNSYITYRAPAYQLLYPVVSFLRIFHAAMLATPDVSFLSNLIEVQFSAMSQEDSL